MSTSTQEKFTAAMEEIAESNHVQLVVDTEWSNLDLGVYRFQPARSFGSLVEVSFDFQPTTARFTITSGDALRLLGAIPFERLDEVRDMIASTVYDAVAASEMV